MPSTRPVKKTSAQKSYERPKLTTYGKLRDLTTGGSGNAVEPSSGKKTRP